MFLGQAKLFGFRLGKIRVIQFSLRMGLLGPSDPCTGVTEVSDKVGLIDTFGQWVKTYQSAKFG